MKKLKKKTKRLVKRLSNEVLDLLKSAGSIAECRNEGSPIGEATYKPKTVLIEDLQAAIEEQAKLFESDPEVAMPDSFYQDAYGRFHNGANEVGWDLMFNLPNEEFVIKVNRETLSLLIQAALNCRDKTTGLSVEDLLRAIASLGRVFSEDEEELARSLATWKDSNPEKEARQVVKETMLTVDAEPPTSPDLLRGAFDSPSPAERTAEQREQNERASLEAPGDLLTASDSEDDKVPSPEIGSR